MSNDVFVYDTGQAAHKPVETKHEIPIGKLVTADSPILTEVMPEYVFTVVEDSEAIASMLVETCKKHNGLGLSANQIGVRARVFVMGSGDNFIACFNPKVISSEGENHMPEGCLSFPLLQLNITRPKTITVEYQDWNGEKHTTTFSGLTARVFLHELDHMNGIVYTTRAKPLALQSGFKKMEKTKRKYFEQVMKKVNNGQEKRNTGYR